MGEQMKPKVTLGVGEDLKSTLETIDGIPKERIDDALSIFGVKLKGTKIEDDESSRDFGSRIIYGENEEGKKVRIVIENPSQD